MNSLEYPARKRWIAGILAFIVIALANILFRLPNWLLAVKFGFFATVIHVVAGEGPAYRAARDIQYVFGQGGETAEIFRRVLIGGRYDDLAGIIKGAAIRSMPWA